MDGLEARGMKEIPILFSGPMVQAILTGNKTMTRRVIKPQPDFNMDFIGWCNDSTEPKHVGCAGFGKENYVANFRRCPYGQPGDRLYVKEAIKIIDWTDGIPGIAYVADDEPVWDITRPCRWVWKNKSLPSMYMPKSSARIWLEVVSVRAERLQDITEEDAKSEGIYFEMAMEYSGWSPTYNDPDGSNAYPNYVEAFKDLWDSINSSRDYGWDSNPYVWVVGFKRITDERII